MADLEDFDDVLKAIGELDKSGYFRTGLDNLMTDVSRLKSGNKWSKYSDAVDNINGMVERLAIESYYQLMKNKKELAEEKADELYDKYAAIPEEKRDEKAEAYEAYNDAQDEVNDLDFDCEQINAHIEAVYVSAADAPFNH